MPWIAKVRYSFNQYLGEDGSVVHNISEAKIFKTKKEANETISKKKTTSTIELLKVTNSK